MRWKRKEETDGEPQGRPLANVVSDTSSRRCGSAASVDLTVQAPGLRRTHQFDGARLLAGNCLPPAADPFHGDGVSSKPAEGLWPIRRWHARWRVARRW